MNNCVTLKKDHLELGTDSQTYGRQKERGTY